jgi:MFS family permease
MALVPVLWLSFVAAVVFGTVFSVAIVLALTLAQETAEDRIRGRVMGSVQMLFRVGLAAGALGVGALAHSIRELDLWVTLDGNQVGLIAGGVLILLGALASSSVAREGIWAGTPRAHTREG